MPYYYFDSTALVKRYSMERGTRIVNKLMVKRGKVAILPTWTVTELYSAFSNRAQQGELTRDDCYSVIHKFERESAEGLFQFIVPTLKTYNSLLRAKPLDCISSTRRKISAHIHGNRLGTLIIGNHRGQHSCPVVGGFTPVLRAFNQRSWGSGVRREIRKCMLYAALSHGQASADSG